MKLLILIFLVWLLATWWSEAGGRLDRAAAIPPPMATTDLVDLPDGLVNWFVRIWAETGFEMPASGQPFAAWSAYLSEVTTGPAEPGDMVEWMETGHPVYGLVIENTLDASCGCVGPATGIVTEVPFAQIGEQVFSLTNLVDRKTVVGYMRPHPKGQRKGIKI